MTDKRKEQSEKLLQAAYDLVAEVGISGLRTRDIAQRAGVNLAVVHYCFESKESLLRALYDFIVARFRAESEPFLTGKTSPPELLDAQMQLRARFLRDDPKALRVWRAFQGEAWTSPTIRDIIRKHSAEMRGRYAKMIAEGRRGGAFQGLPGRDDRLAASLLMSLYDGLLFQWALDPEAFAIEDYAEAVKGWVEGPRGEE